MDRMIIILALIAGIGTARVLLHDEIRQAKEWVDVTLGKFFSTISQWVVSIFRVDLDDENF